MRINALCLTALAAVLSPDLQAAERMTPELLWELGRIGGATVSSDGATLVYTTREVGEDERTGEYEKRRSEWKRSTLD